MQAFLIKEWLPLSFQSFCHVCYFLGNNQFKTVSMLEKPIFGWQSLLPYMRYVYLLPSSTGKWLIYTLLIRLRNFNSISSCQWFFLLWILSFIKCFIYSLHVVNDIDWALNVYHSWNNLYLSRIYYYSSYILVGFDCVYTFVTQVYNPVLLDLH